MSHHGHVFALPIVIAVFIGGCSVSQKKGDAALEASRSDLMEVCSLGGTTHHVTGAVWLNLNSPEARGQFPATVDVKGTELKMEATNLLGGTEALIHVSDSGYQVTFADPAKNQKSDQKSWGGIPLRWASKLFLGQIPCPTLDAPSGLKISSNEPNVVVAESKEGTFVYKLKSWAGKKWPLALKWTSTLPSEGEVDFEFMDPDASTSSPRRWKATSPLGDVKARWTKREIKIQ
jgi:hypothetical protein